MLSRNIIDDESKERSDIHVLCKQEKVNDNDLDQDISSLDNIIAQDNKGKENLLKEVKWRQA